MADFPQVGLEAVIAGMPAFNKAASQIQKTFDGINKAADGVANLSSPFVSLGNSVLSFGALAAKAAAGGIAALIAGVAALGVTSVNAAISFESAFAGVTKTIDGLADDTGKLTALGEEIRGQFEQLSTQIPATFEDISAVGEIGGQLGVGPEAITDFTNTVIGLRETTNLTADEAATALARIGNIYQITADQLGTNTEQIGSTVVALGNNFATTESDIVNFGLRIAGAGRIAGLSQDEILGIGAAFSSIGVDGEAGGTAVQKVLLAMNGAVNATSDGFVDNTKAIDTNTAKLRDLQATSARLEAQAPGLQEQILAQYDAFIAAGGSASDFGRQLGDKTIKASFDTALAIRDLTTETQLLRDQQGQPIDAGQLQKFAEIAGVSADEFKRLWSEDASEAFQLFVEGLGADSQNAEGFLKDLGLADQRLIRAFLGLSGAGDLLSNTLDVASQAWEENTALTNEAQKRYATTASQIQILKNTFRLLLAQIGERFLPLVNRVIESAKSLIQDWAKPIQNAIDTIIIPAIDRIIGAFQQFGARGAAVSILGLLGLEPGQIIGVITTIDSIIATITNAFAKISTSFAAFGVTGATGTILGLLGFDSTTITTVISVSQTIIDAFSNLATQVVSLLSQISFDEILGALIGIGAVLAAGVFAAIVAGLASLITPVTAIIAVAALLGAAWAGNWFGIQEVTISVISYISNLFTTLSGLFMQTVAGPLSQAFGNLTVALGNLGLTWGDVWNAIVQATTIVAAVIGTVILGIISLVVGFVTAFTNAFAAASTFFPTIATGIMNVLTGIGTAFAGTVALFQNLINGEWTAAWQSFLTIIQGNLTLLGGLFQTVIGVIGAALGAIIGLITGFISGTITTFQNLYTALVGGSIIPDMMNAIIQVFVTGLATVIETVLSFGTSIADVFGTIAESVGTLLSGLFGGGEGGGASILTFNPAEMLAGIQQVQAAFATLQQVISNIATTALVALSQATLVNVQVMIPIIQQVLGVVQQILAQINNISTVALPLLQVTTTTTAAIMVAAFQTVIAVLQQIMQLISQIMALLTQMAAIAKKVGGEIASAFEKAADKIKDMISVVFDAANAFQKLAAAAKEAATAANSAGSASGDAGGLGFQHGTGASGFIVPKGFNNDTFPLGPMVSTGERVFVQPRAGASVQAPPNVQAPALGATGNTTIINNFYTGGNTIADTFDLATFEARLVSTIMSQVG